MTELGPTLAVAWPSGAGPVLAAGDVPAFLAPLAAMIVAAAAVAWICQRLGLVPIVGFLLAGVLIGPHALGVVDQAETVQTAAELGVVLLLFSIGIEFSLERLARVRRLIVGAGSLSVALTTALTAVVLLAAGAPARPALYTGLLVAVSSTAVVLSLLGARHQTTTPAGQLTVAVLVFEDMAVVALVLLVPMLGTEGGSPLDLVGALATAAGVLAGVLLVARRLMPPLLEAVARLCSPQVFLLVVIGICIVTAYLTATAGVGVSLGAFLAGLLVSESRFSAHALGEILPLQIVFTAVFFLSVGMLLDPAFLAREPLLVLAGVVGVVVLKATTGTVAGRLMGAALPVAAASAVLKSQIGEFSFVLEQVGRKAGLTPADLGQDGVQAFLATTVVLMTLTPGLGPLGDGLARRLEARSRMGAGRRQGPGGASAGPGDEVGLPGADHVVLAGYGDGARALVPALVRSSVPFVVVTLDPQGALQAEGLGVPVVRGDSARAGTLEQAGVRRARALVIADHQADPAARIAQLARSLNPHVALIVRLADEHGVDELAAAGVDRIVTGTRASRAGLAETVLAELAVVEVDSVFDPAPSFDLDAVVRTAVSPASSCTHRDQVRPVLPSAPGCEECLQSGDRWVHLRICSTCGHVGCCDDSPNRHARAHWAGSAHPIMRSIEPGERWAWCFQDQLEP